MKWSELSDDSSKQEKRVLVAEMMGWHRSILGNWPWQMVPPGGDGTQVENVPDYLQDMNATLDVIEKFNPSSFAVGREHGYFMEPGPVKWICQIVDGPRVFGVNPAETICHAACLAAGLVED
jgi:hypothetical protein